MQFIAPKRIRRGLGLLLALCLLFLVCPESPAQIQNKSGALSIITQSGEDMELYRNSHALLIGVQDYKSGWPKLPNLKQHIEMLQKALHDQGFSVVTVFNPDSKTLKAAFENFMERYGYDANSRLLFYFGGHGAMRRDGRTGYLAPGDAPLPRDDPKAFKRKALSISRVLAWCKDLESRHAMFLFDSSLKAGLFHIQKHGPARPINAQTAKPVRFIISSGAAGQDALAQSVFAPSLVQGLKGKADLNQDGFITGSELGRYVHERALEHQTGQAFQYGKLLETKPVEGDFVFKLSGAGASPDPKAAKIAHLLKGAKALLAARKFSQPDEVNALDKYNQVLSLDPLNLDAKVGLGLIIEEYALWARSLMKAGELTEAEKIIKRAQSVREGDTAVVRLWQELGQLKSLQPKAPPKGEARAQAESGASKSHSPVAGGTKEPQEDRITPGPAKPHLKPELIEARSARDHKPKSGSLNLVWAKPKGNPIDRYQRIYVWLGKADPKTGVWRYRKQRMPDLEKNPRASLAATGLGPGRARLLVSGCRVWDERKNACSQEETIPLSITQKRFEKPKGYLSITPGKLPKQVILDHRYAPAAPLKAAAAPSSGKLKGKLHVTASLDDGTQPPKDNPIWVYVKVYDRQDRMIRILRKAVQQNSKAVFDYAKFGKDACQATVFAFWPGDLGPDDPPSGPGIMRKRGYYLPEIRKLDKLDKPSGLPDKLIIRLSPMPTAKQMQALATIDNQFIAKLNGTGLHRITDAGSGVLQGKYNVWIPLIDGLGHKADNLMAMLLLFNRAKELKYGHVAYSQTAKDGRSYAVYPAEIFNHDVYLAQLFVCSPEHPDRFVPKIDNLDAGKPEISEPGEAGNQGPGGYASFPLVRVDVLNGQGFSGVYAGPKPKKPVAHRHPRRGVLNALVLDQDAKPLQGVSVLLLAEDGSKAWAQSGESGLISIPLLDQKAGRLELSKKKYKFISGSLKLPARPKKIYQYRFSPAKARIKSKKITASIQPGDKKPAKLARLTGKLLVSVSLEGGRQPPVHESIWVYVQSFDRKGKRLAVIGKEVNAEGKALFSYSRLGRGVSKAKILAFYPHYIEEAGSGGNGERGYNTHARSLYFQPCQKILASLHKPDKAPKKIDLLLKLMPAAKITDGDPGEGLLEGEYRIWVPVMDDMGHAVEDIFCMLLLYDKHENLLHGNVVFSRIFDNGMSYAEYHSHIFNPKVASARLFLCSQWHTASYIPRLKPLNTKNPRKFKIDDGYIMLPAAELPDTKIEMIRGGPDQAMRLLQ